MRRLTLLLAVTAAVCETYRRGYAAPIIYGVRQHCRSCPDWLYEPDVMT